MEITVKELSEMTTKELLTIFEERVKVFVVEQNCPYQEVDKADEHALHVSLLDKNTFVGYTRIIDYGTYVTFGRVLIIKEYRTRKLGSQLIEATLKEIETRYPRKDIKISAQHYLLDFYKKFGFEAISEMYLEDSIPHVDMLLRRN